TLSSGLSVTNLSSSGMPRARPRALSHLVTVPTAGTTAHGVRPVTLGPYPWSHAVVPPTQEAGQQCHTGDLHLAAPRRGDRALPRVRDDTSGCGGLRRAADPERPGDDGARGPHGGVDPAPRAGREDGLGACPGARD